MSREITVGQKLIFVRRFSLIAEELIVTKVGRKWLDTHLRIRVDKKTMFAENDGTGNIGRCWESRASYDVHCLRLKYWQGLCKFMHQNGGIPPRNAALTDLIRVAKIFGFEVEGVTPDF
jgi:hypothetical protein